MFPKLSTLASLEDAGEIDFRTYQMLAMMSFLLCGRGVIRSATGSGKTLIAAAIAGALNKPTLGVIHGSALLEQTRGEMARFLGTDIGLIEQKTMDLQHFTLASVDTLRSQLKSKNSVLIDYLSSVEFLFFDETHHASADSWQKVSKMCPAPFRLGLSGTPFKNEAYADSKLVAVCGPLLCDISTAVLQKLDYISLADLIIWKNDWDIPGGKKLKWQQAHAALVVNNTARNYFIADKIADIMAADAEATILVLTGNSVALGEGIIAAFRDSYGGDDNTIRFMSGKKGSAAVVRSLDALRAGELKCLVVTKLADEGIDAPSVNHLLLVGGGKSYVQTIQRIGRGLRKKKDGSVLCVQDFWALGNKYIEKHNRARLRIYREEELFKSTEVYE
jgi:superfamily II DNA or RNA helicase